VWWEDAVVYQVYPRSFADEDGDGAGDLPGLRSRLEHLADLGVDAVWLTPVPNRCSSAHLIADAAAALR
jgi:glycosidase